MDKETFKKGEIAWTEITPVEKETIKQPPPGDSEYWDNVFTKIVEVVLPPGVSPPTVQEIPQDATKTQGVQLGEQPVQQTQKDGTETQGEKFAEEFTQADERSYLNAIKSSWTFSQKFQKLVEGAVNADLTDITDLIQLDPIFQQLDSEQMLEDFVVECSYDRVECNKTRHFYAQTNKKYGHCFTFNAQGYKGPLLESRRPGAQFGLKLTLNISHSEYVGILASEYGVRVSIDDNMVIPYPHMDGFNAPAGMLTEVGVKRQSVHRLKHPFESDCKDDYEASYKTKKFIPPEVPYSYRTCRFACIDMAMAEQCGCIAESNYAYHVKERPAELPATCDIFNSTQRTCTRKLLQSLNGRHEASFGFAQVVCDCKWPCNDYIYKRSISKSPWPSLQYAKLRAYNFLMKDKASQIMAKGVVDAYYHQTDVYVEKDLARLHVYYEELSVEVVEEHVAYPFIKMIADMGGIIGLYLGISIGTLFEVVGFFFNFERGHKFRFL